MFATTVLATVIERVETEELCFRGAVKIGTCSSPFHFKMIPYNYIVLFVLHDFFAYTM